MIAVLLNDHTLLLYSYLNLITLYTASLLTFVWIKKKAASPVYIYVNLLIWGIFINSILLFIARYYYFTDLIFRDKIIASFIWPCRMYIIIISMTAIAVHMTYRIITNKPGEYPFGLKIFKNEK